MFVRMMFRAAALFAFVVQAAIAAPATTVPIKHMYVIGDSLSDQGNLFFATGILGPALGIPPIPDANFYYLGRFSNGPNYVDLLAQKFGITVTASELGGTNFADGGARTDYNVVEFRPGVPSPINGYFPIGAFPWSIDAQREAFLASVKHRGADPTGLYIVLAGSNDLSDALFYLSQDHDFVAASARVQKAVMGTVDVVLAYKAAGARTILVPLVPNLGVIPVITHLPTPPVGPPATFVATLLSAQFNAALVAALSTIDGPNIITFDTFSFITSVVQNPAAFGLTNASDACFTGFVVFEPGTICATPDTYAFWDREHPTTRLFSILADELYTATLQCEGKQNQQWAKCAVNKH